MSLVKATSSWYFVTKAPSNCCTASQYAAASPGQAAPERVRRPKQKPPCLSLNLGSDVEGFAALSVLEVSQ